MLLVVALPTNSCNCCTSLIHLLPIKAENDFRRRAWSFRGCAATTNKPLPGSSAKLSFRSKEIPLLPWKPVRAVNRHLQLPIQLLEVPYALRMIKPHCRLCKKRGQLKARDEHPLMFFTFIKARWNKGCAHSSSWNFCSTLSFVLIWTQRKSCLAGPYFTGTVTKAELRVTLSRYVRAANLPQH